MVFVLFVSLDHYFDHCIIAHRIVRLMRRVALFYRLWMDSDER